MKKGKIVFSLFDLLVDGIQPSYKHFSSLKKVGNFVVDDKVVTYNLSCDEGDGDYIWLAGKYGAPLPHANEVVDVRTGEYLRNPRTINQAELRHQWFAIYFFPTRTLYMPRGAKTIVERLLEKLLMGKVSVLNVYKDKDDFLKTLEHVKNVRFIEVENLFTEKEGLFSSIKDACGLGNPQQLKVDLKFERVSKTVKFCDWFTSLIRKYDEGQLYHLEVVGLCKDDDRLVESVFNVSSFEQQIVCKCGKDENEMYDEVAVKNEILDKLLRKE